MREAESNGIIQAPPALREVVRALPYSESDIDRGLALLVDREGNTIGGNLEIDSLEGLWTFGLWEAGMIEHVGGRWVLTTKGTDLSQLLDEYAHSKHHWRILPREFEEDAGGNRS
jgi:hypothetical protein